MSWLPQPGDIWNDRYEISAVLGRGGFGRVYRAWDRLLERDIAIKMLRQSDTFTPADQARFRREMNIAASLDHPNIVTIFDGGELDGLLYLVMRFVAGRDLRHELADGPLGQRRTVSIVGQVGAALDYAHNKGLVHRDVKPGNVLCQAGTDTVFLTDFGISRQVDQTTDNPVTQGLAPATLAYASPEQMRTDTRVDGRTDVYALGCVLFECLTGRKPFEGEMAAMITSHLHDDPPRVSAVRPDLPRAWDAVVATAMAKEPRERFQRCAQLTVAAQAVVRGRAAAGRARVSGPARPRIDDVAVGASSPGGRTRRFGRGAAPTQHAPRPSAEPASDGASDPTRVNHRPVAETVPAADIPAAPPVRPSAASPTIARDDTAEREPTTPRDATVGHRSGEAPHRDGRRRRLLSPMVLAVATAAVFGWLAWQSVGAGDDAPDSAAGDSAEALDPAQVDLLETVGGFTADVCSQPTRDPLPGQQEAVACTDAGQVPSRVVLRRFTSVEARDAAFADIARSAGDGDCAVDRRATHAYEGAAGTGRVVCAVDDATAGLSWTVPDEPVMGSARLDDPAAADELYLWWSDLVRRADA